MHRVFCCSPLALPIAILVCGMIISESYVTPCTVRTVLRGITVFDVTVECFVDSFLSGVSKVISDFSDKSNFVLC